MDKYDSRKRVALMLDEWGTWWDEEPGTIRGHLYQQNTMRDAFVAALTLNVFHKYTDRLKMANIAQIANVLQSMILTKDDKMVLTPTYHVFDMYKVHQEATHLPIDLRCEVASARSDYFGKKEGQRPMPMLSATASRDKDGVIHISLANVSLTETNEVELSLDDIKVKDVTGTILVSKNIADHNTFENPDLVKPAPFKGAKVNKGTLKVTLPAMSIVTLEVK